MQALLSQADDRPMLPKSLSTGDDGDPHSDNFPVVEDYQGGERNDFPVPTEAKTSDLLEEIRQLKINDEARRLLESAGISHDPVKIRALTALDTAEERQALLETWPAPASRKPRSISPAMGFGRVHQLPADPKSFATMIR